MYIGLGSNIEPERYLPLAVQLWRRRSRVTAVSSAWMFLFFYWRELGAGIWRYAFLASLLAEIYPDYRQFPLEKNLTEISESLRYSQPIQRVPLSFY